MGVRDFFRDIPYSLNGKNYGELAKRPNTKAITYIMGCVIFAFLIMCLFGIPKLIGFGEYIDSELNKIDKIQIDGKILMNEAIIFPEDDPLIAIDATNNTKKAEARKMLVTQEFFYWKTMTGDIKKVKMADWFRNPESRRAISSFIFLIALMILPGFLFWFIILLIVKYLLITILFAGIFFILLDLTKFRMSFKKMFNVCAYASTLLIFIEVIFIPLGTDYLIPLFEIFWIQFYLVTSILYIALVVIALIFAESQGEGTYAHHHNSHRSHHHKKKKEEPEPQEIYNPPEEDEIIDIDEHGNKKGKNHIEEDFAGWDGPVEKF